ncbi:hypothetical protein PN462_09455 [Spirulina sp. CS-785/01]|uniref:hypothetical protein n=1 Tax=Spirulina sp. CS-785/01 TaxID=3021716 RepID=UPI00232EBD6B|nr:hypothetical protein [Spirulina sp. CS-785/01]MDB9313324.1 hypothetical protein [Spirulina sp. CS-785/01]
MFRLFNRPEYNNPARKSQAHRIIELSDNVKVQTEIKTENVPALRAGFAGYPRNPRWNATKFYAWKTGCQWRNALDTGEMTICSDNAVLTTVTPPSEVKNHDKVAEENVISPTFSSDNDEFQQRNDQTWFSQLSKVPWTKISWKQIVSLTLKPVSFVKS